MLRQSAKRSLRRLLNISFFCTDALDDVAATGVCPSRRGAQALLLDCIGFVETHRRQLAQASGLPVILPNALMAKIVGEMVAG